MTAVNRVKSALDRAANLDGYANSIIDINNLAIEQAKGVDQSQKKGLLHGEPVLVKDNIDVAGMATTAGSLALKDNFVKDDAPVVRSLKKHGAVVIGKTNLSEWACFRDDYTKTTCGWSAVGGLTKNPIRDPDDPDKPLTAFGSSSGSGAAVALGIVDAALGSETDGSITGVASMCGIVGLKPTVGLLSSDGMVPIALSQDTAGPMTKNVRLTARLLTAMGDGINYEGQLDGNCLDKARIGVMRFHCGQFGQEVDRCFEEALSKLREAGATIVDIPEEAKPDIDKIEDLEYKLFLREFKSDLNGYLKTTDPKNVPSRTLNDLIKFNLDHAEEEMKYMDQEIFEQADATLGREEPDYPGIAAEAKHLSGKEGIDKLLKDFDCQVLIAPTNGPAFRIDLEGGDGVHGLNTLTTRRTTLLPAVSGYPHLTVPMGKVEKVKPVGMSFIGAANSEAKLLSFGYAFEQLMT